MSSGDEAKTTLGADERRGIWRIQGKKWPYYAWGGAEWRAYPSDPRTSADLISTRAMGQKDGELTNPRGFEDVTNAHR